MRRCSSTSGSLLRFASPEDVILKKMSYYKEGGSQKHIRDIVGVLKIQGEKIDLAYIESWIEKLDLSDVWMELRNRMSS